MPTIESRLGLQLSEDWLATIIGLILALVIGLGLLGPGQQTIILNAESGVSTAKSTLSISGWVASATLAGKTAPIAAAPTSLQAGKTYLITCEADKLTAVEANSEANTFPDGVSPAQPNHSQIVLINNCADVVRVTYTSSAAIPYPLFRIF